ncbi:MAG: glycoside hydrolase family 2 TIM barrel-domain containing protein, partial [Bifidobacterium sp.]|nr:glycoside hydrolase family 2 TIM barrel-domain containing protein [Bifidobacterium sp.]
RAVAALPALPALLDVPAFAFEGFDDEAFAPVAVPGNLETQGFMDPQYVNIQYPWDGHEDVVAPGIPEANHVALYRTAFTPSARVAAAMAHRGDGERVTLTFHGARTAIYVWLNGRFVGYSEDSYTPSEFDVTDLLREGGNTLAVACCEHSSASWLEDQDAWRLHGLFRSVDLAVRPAAHVRDLRADADYDPATGCGTLDVTALVEGARRAAHAQVSLSAPDGTRVFSTCLGAHEVLRVREQCGPVRPWSAEDPARYLLTVTLRDADGALVERAECHVGFRRVAIEDGILKVNGERVLLHGVNRHEFDARRGQAVTMEDMLWDVRFMKRHHINAVRTSHYPNDERWLALCDEYGLYVVDEANLETHGSWNLPGDTTDGVSIPGGDPQWLGACVDRLESMVARDRTHPSVIMWSLGNESYAGDVIAAMDERCRMLDPTCPVHYEGVTWNRAYDAISDVESRMYAKPDDIRAYVANDPAKPFISCEFMHAMGNSCGGLTEYMELERYPHYQGGFIWDFIDQALEQRLPDGTVRLAYGGDFADRPNDGEFSGDGLVFADRTPSPKAQEVKACYAPVRFLVGERDVLISNRNRFVDTSDSVFVARMLVDGRETWRHEFRAAVPARSTRRVPVDFPSPAVPRGEVVHEVAQCLAHDTAWAPAGYELASGQSLW